MSRFGPEQQKRENLDKWAKAQGIPALPGNLQQLPPEQIEMLFQLYLSTLKRSESDLAGPLDYSEENRKRLEAVKWAVQHGKMNEDRTSNVRSEIEELLKIVLPLATDPTPISIRKPLPNTQYAMRGKRS